jgi:hypothetical protein
MLGDNANITIGAGSLVQNRAAGNIGLYGVAATPSNSKTTVL